MDDNGPRRVRLRGGGPRAQDRDRPGPRTTRWPVPADFPPPLASADPGLRSASAVSSPAPPVTYPAARSCPCAGFALYARRGGQFRLEGDVPAVAIRHREGRVMTAPDHPAGPAVCADPSPPGRPDRVRRAPRPPPGTATAPSRGTCAATTARPRAAPRVLPCRVLGDRLDSLSRAYCQRKRPVRKRDAQALVALARRLVVLFLLLRTKCSFVRVAAASEVWP
jgi:hypothetical protein